MGDKRNEGYRALENAGNTRLGKVNAEGDIVQFASAIYIVDSDAGTIRLDIMRIGQKTDTISFWYKTVSGSAVPGKQYTHIEGEITIEPGVDSASVEVPIQNDDAWNATKEFTVELCNPDNCELGLYLKVARVKVRDTSKFPDDGFKEYVEEHYQDGEFDIDEVPELKLFFSFCRLLYKFEGVACRTWLMIFFDQLHNVYKYARLILAVYMVDKVFNFHHDKDDLLIPGNRLASAYVIAGCIITPIIGFYFLDLTVINVDVRGRLRGFMARSLFRKYMNYNAESRDSVPISDQIATLTQDVNGVTNGYLTLVSMGKLAGKIGISIFFTLQQNPDAWWAVIAIPSVMMLWCALRTRTYVKALDTSDEIDAQRTVFAQEVLSKMNLVAAYAQRPQMNELFALKCDELKQARLPEYQIVLTNTFLPEALGPAMVALYTAIGAELVLKGELKLGVYLATISVFGDICDTFSQLFGKVMDIISTFTGLKGMFELLNRNTDLLDIKAMNVAKEVQTMEKRRALTDMPPGPGWAPRIDRLDIQLTEVSFSYPGVSPVEIFQGINFRAKQGEIVGIRGKSGSGRKTLMELLSQQLFPSGGTIFIPSHLRVLYVSRELILLNLSLWQNLTFGNRKGNQPSRVEDILKHFEMKEVLQDEGFKKDMEGRKREISDQAHGVEFSHEQEEKKEEEQEEVQKGANALDKLREGTKAYVHLARAFIMNPEVMIMHRPFVHHHGNRNYELLKCAIKDHRDHRGFKMDPKKIHRRRPRTVFFSADHPKPLQIADTLWLLPSKMAGDCVQRAPREEDYIELRCDSCKQNIRRSQTNPELEYTSVNLATNDPDQELPQEEEDDAF